MPPKCLFDFPPRPHTQLITVPCCETCRRSGESDEALYRNLFISTRETERHPSAKKLAKKRDRCFDEDFSQVQRAVEHMVPVLVETPGSSFVAPGFNFDSPPVRRFVLRVCRALLHKETKLGFVECKIRDWSVNPKPDVREIFQVAPSRVVSDEFAYAVIYHREEDVSAWLLNFYQSLEFFVIMEIAWD